MECLAKLEYRGYDSAGIATIDRELQWKKCMGPVEGLSSAGGELGGNIGIGHTRWATHGEVTISNAHPQVDCSGNIAIVHNGIVENADILREELTNRGHRFTSDTDTEVISHLVEEEVREGSELSIAISNSSRRLEGKYSFLVLTSWDRDHIVACKKGLPLVIGEGPDGRVASSDPFCLPKFVCNFTALEDGEIALISQGRSELIESSQGRSVTRRSHTRMDWSRDLGRSGYAHFMKKEIYQQPNVLYRSGKSSIQGLEEMAGAISRCERAFLIGSGTSYHACLTGSYLINELGGLCTYPMLSSRFSSFSKILGENDLVLAVSQSGETSDILDAVECARGQGTRVVGMMNNAQSTLERASDFSICLGAGVEVSVAATKTYIAEVAAFYLMAQAMRGTMDRGRSKLIEAAGSMATWIPRWDEEAGRLAKSMKDSSVIAVIGRDLTYPSALETALKIREICYLPSLGLEGSELRHGSLALISEGVPCLVFAAQDSLGIVNSAREAKTRGARLIGITNGDELEFDEQFVVPGSGDLFSVMGIVPAQLLAYHMAILRGNNPDRPRNLAKCVTVR